MAVLGGISGMVLHSGALDILTVLGFLSCNIVGDEGDVEVVVIKNSMQHVQW